jgi:flagellar biosynthesis protein FlhB
MFLNVKNIKTNAKKSLYTNINGEDEKWSYAYIFVKIVIPIISCLIVYINQDKLMEDPKVIVMLLSLFSGLMFGVLIKIPDKFKDLEPKKDETKQDETKRKQVKNYLKLFMYSLSYSILVALFSIFFVILNSFFPSLIEIKLSKFEIIENLKQIDIWTTVKVLTIILYRILLVNYLLNFLFFIFKAVTNLYEFMLYEFNKIK